MKHFIVFPVFVTILTSVCTAQTITHGPFTGAVTSGSARIFFRTSSQIPTAVILSTDSASFSNPLTFSGTTDPQNDTTAIIDVSGLNPSTKYFYRIDISGNPVTGVQSFTTFPLSSSTAPFSFTFGSCEGFSSSPPANEPVFDQMVKHKPSFFLHCGDWGYPDYTDNFPQDTNFFSLDMNNIFLSYRLKYHPTAPIRKILDHTPVDYVYDDHDYMNDNSARDYSPEYSTQVGIIKDHLNPPGVRENSIRAYTRLFPTYPLPDTTEGIYHSFRFGNAEFFICDNRSARSGPFECFVPDTADTNYLMVNCPPGHSILGQKQMNWLINGLKTSTARWKFIITGVMFNYANRNILEYALTHEMQDSTLVTPYGILSGKNLAGGLADTWTGFQDDQRLLLTTCRNDSITNVIFLTSDSHTSAIDDGANAGFPELMSGNLSQTNSRLAWLMEYLGFGIWNSGGQGLGNSNFNDAFGKIEVFGNDSARLSIIDTGGTEISHLIIHDGILPPPVGILEKNKKPDLHLSFHLFPNPASGEITVRMQREKYFGADVRLEIINVSGQTVSTLNRPLAPELILPVSSLPPGMYYCRITAKKSVAVKAFTKN